MNAVLINHLGLLANLLRLEGFTTPIDFHAPNAVNHDSLMVVDGLAIVAKTVSTPPIGGLSKSGWTATNGIVSVRILRI